METKIITAEKGNKWIGDIKELNGYLPENCILDKGITGCGATTLAIDNDRPTIIAVPSINLIRNKTAQKPNLFGVWGEVSNREIADYLNSTDRWKIMATYDAIPRIVDVAGADIYRRAFLLVDENHRLLHDYNFRHDAVTGLLEHAPRFDCKTFMSATPIEREFLLDELQDMDMTKIIWPYADPLQIRLWEEKSPFAIVKALCMKAIREGDGSNLHFFLNTVKWASRVSLSAKLSPDMVRHVCAESDENQDKLADCYTIGTPNDPVRKINFYTSTAFEGCDIHDKQGRIYIVSDGQVKHSMLDVSTSIRQIAGRIRDTQYKEITHIFSRPQYGRDVTYEQFCESTDSEIERAKRWIRWHDKADKDLQAMTKADNKYINPETKKLDMNRVKYDKMTFRNQNEIYADGSKLITEHIRNGHLITSTAKHNITARDLEINDKAKKPFRQLFEDYADARTDTNIFSMKAIYANNIAKRNPLIVESYEKLGVDRVRELKYNQTQIRRELLKLSPTDLAYKITQRIKEDIAQRTAIPAKTAKDKLQAIYNDLGVKRTAKATDIAEWFDIEKCYRNIDGKNTACIIIIRSRIIVKKVISAEGLK